MPGAPQVLVVITLDVRAQQALDESYRVHYSPALAGARLPDSAALREVRAVVTNGSTGLSGTEMERMPALELVCCFGAGYENVDLDAARRRGIVVGHAPGANGETVADHALALALALARGLAPLDRAVREGRWNESRGERAALNGSRAGIIGLGRIGSAIARRASAFNMTIGYHARNPRNDVSWRHHASAEALARASDFLFIACPGGAATRHLVGRGVLEALGPQGFLVNVARGSVVDTPALVQALRERRIAGAGLDVIEGEPAVPAELLGCPDVLFTPHLAGRSPAALRAQLETLLANLRSHFAGRALAARVP